MSNASPTDPQFFGPRQGIQISPDHHNDMSSTASTSTTAACGACDTTNDGTSPFCSGCGHALLEKCFQCGQEVRLAQKFCGGCGTNLYERVEANRERHEQRLRESVQAAKSHQFEESVALLEGILATPDYRYAEVQRNAQTALAKIQTIRESAEQDMRRRVEAAEHAATSGNHAAVIQQLGELPDALLDDASRKRLQASRQYVEEVRVLESEAQSAIENKNWMMAGGALGRLMRLLPDAKLYRKLASDLIPHCVRASDQHLRRGKLDHAADFLHAIPSEVQSKELLAKREQIDDYIWLSEQLSDQPFASPTLGNLAVRLQKDLPDYLPAAESLAELRSRLKQRPDDPRSTRVRWRGDGRHRFGGPLHPLDFPVTLRWPSDLRDSSFRGQMAVASGLALAGLGLGLINTSLTGSGGLLKTFRKKKSNACWGVDLGSSTVRALRIEKTEDGPRVTHATSVDIAVKDQDVSGDARMAIIRAAAKQLSAQVEVGDDPVWISLPDIEAVHHFVRLPPLAEKQLDKLLEAEIRSRIPVDPDQLHRQNWRAPSDSEDPRGTPALTFAARKNRADIWSDAFASAGFDVAGMQTECVAGINFLHHEFCTGPDALEHPIFALEMGTANIRLTAIGPRTLYSTHLSGGGGSITSALTQRTGLTRDDAERMKRTPFKLAHPSAEWSAVDQTLVGLGDRIDRLVAEVRKHEALPESMALWTFGGGTQTHDFHRRCLTRCNRPT